MPVWLIGGLISVPLPFVWAWVMYRFHHFKGKDTKKKIKTYVILALPCFVIGGFFSAAAGNWWAGPVMAAIVSAFWIVSALEVRAL